MHGLSKDLSGKPDVLAVVLGGGRGTRLFPLTQFRSKPAVPLAGKYRLIDVPLSNCINSDIRKIFVLTQFNSASLNRHIANTYKFDKFSNGYVEIIAADQSYESEQWFQGTADAVRRTLSHLKARPSSHVLILSGDALYRQDYQEVLARHIADGAEITVCCKLVGEQQASDFGIVGIDNNRQILSFHEKPKGDALTPLKVDVSVMRDAGLECSDGKSPYLASMGIYLFNTDVLINILENSHDEDFGKQIIPAAINKHKIFANLFDGYWEDIGTIRAFFQANLDLLEEHPQFTFYDSHLPIYTHSRLLPSSEIFESRLDRSMMGEGCLIRSAEITNSIIGIRSIIREGSRLENTIMMGADGYENFMGPETLDAPGIGLGKNVRVRNAIIDKNARIGDNCRLLNENNVIEVDGPCYYIRDGIIIIPKNMTVPAGTIV